MSKMTIKQCREIAIQHINQYSIAGTPVPPTYNNQADYEIKVLNLINDAQMEIAKNQKRIPAQHIIIQNGLPTAVKIVDTVPKLDTDMVTPDTCEEFGKSYYFEISGAGTVYVEARGQNPDSWNILETIQTAANPDGGFSVYKNNIATPQAGVRLRFSGNGTYLYRNVGIYKCSYADTDDIPVCAGMLAYEMPDDFYQLNGKGVPHVTPTGALKFRHDYLWLGEKTLLLRSDLIGEFIVEYFRYPIRFDSNVNEATTYLDGSADTHEAIPYYVASMLCRYDNPSLADTLYNLFEIKLSRFTESIVSENMMIEDVYGFDAMFGGVV